VAGNYVEIVLKARDEAKPDIDALKLALGDLKGRVETALVEVDDDEAEARLLALRARLDAIGRKVENPRINVQGADKAVADMAAVDVALDKVGGEAGAAAASVDQLKLSLDELNRKVATALAKVDDDEARAKLLALKVKLDEIGRKVASPRISVEGADRAVAELAAVDVALNAVGKSAGQAAEDTGMAMPSLAAINPMMAGMGAAVATAVPVVIGAATSLAAMGAAAAFAYPELKQVYDVMTGTAQAPASGPIAAVVSQLRDLEGEAKQVASMSGVGQNLISKALPAGIEMTENLLRDMSPLARAGAVSIDEIAKAGERVSSSSGFRGFLDDLAKQAPADTNALLGLAGSVGGDLKAAFEAAAPHIGLTLTELAAMAGELKGPLSTAVGGTVQGVGVMADVMTGAIGTASALADGVSAAWEGVSHSVGGSAQDAVHSVDSFRSSESAVKNPSVLEFIGALSGNFSLVNKSAIESATAMGRHAAAAQKAAAEDATFGHQMDIASGSAGTLADRVSALETAIGRESDATAGALGGLVSFHQQMLTTAAAMAASGDKAGYLTKQDLATAAAFATLYGDAKSASGAILQTGGTAQQAAGPLEAMRGEMEKIQDPTAAEAQLLRELNAEIAALHSKTIVIGVRTVEEGTTGQPLPVSGGPTGHPQGGPDAMKPGVMTPGAMTPGAMTPAPAGGGPVQLQIAPGGSGAFERFMATWIRSYVRVHGGGGPQSVQRAFGRAA